MLGFMIRIRIKVLVYNILFFISKVMSKDEFIVKIKELIFGWFIYKLIFRGDLFY